MTSNRNHNLKETDFNPDFYTRLVINENATQEEITKAYKKRAKETHPDLHPENKDAEAEFVAVGRAYEWLKDPAKRRSYDLQLSAKRHKSHASHTTASGTNTHNKEQQSAKGPWGQYARPRYENVEWPRDYTEEDLQRYREAADRLHSGNARKGDLGTVFNLLAGNPPKRGLKLEATPSTPRIAPEQPIAISPPQEQMKFSGSGVPLIRPKS